jgi:hypothetical protein
VCKLVIEQFADGFLFGFGNIGASRDFCHSGAQKHFSSTLVGGLCTFKKFLAAIANLYPPDLSSQKEASSSAKPHFSWFTHAFP